MTHNKLDLEFDLVRPLLVFFANNQIKLTAEKQEDFSEKIKDVFGGRLPPSEIELF